MINIKYKKDDLRYIFLQGDTKELKKLEEYLNKIPDYMFMKGYRGFPRPVVFLNKFKSKSNQIIYYAHSGLYKTIIDWATKNGIEVDGIDNYFKYTDFSLSLKEFEEYIKSWNLNITPRDYQIKAAWLILHYRQSLSQLATRAGKTLIAYMVFRYLLEHGVKKILMIVPSIQLVKQGVEDFKEYKEFFQTEQIWAKAEYCTCANLTIGTYQSLIKRLDPKSSKYDPSFFDGYDCILVDEAHHLVCETINTILKQNFIKNVVVRFGFTGTLPKEGTIDSFCCHSLMGPTIQDLTTNELINGGFLAAPIITQYRINYTPSEVENDFIECAEYLCSNDKVVNGKVVTLSKEQQKFTIKNEKNLPVALKQLKKQLNKKDYIDYLVDLCKSKGANLLMAEQMMVHRSQKHLNTIYKILDGVQKGNCIVFAHHTEYIKFLEKEFKNRYKDKIIYKITGETNLKNRQKILDEMLNSNNVILVASYGCCGTGLTFKNVDYCIFAQSFKSDIINLQSIGRMLLKTEEKSSAYIYDIIDIFPTNQIFSQGRVKINTYKKSKFNFKIEEII